MRSALFWPSACSTTGRFHQKLSMRPRRCTPRSKALRASAFTIVEALVAIAILIIFALTSTMALNFFDERATRNRNAEAARVIVEDYINSLLNDTGTIYAATVDNVDLDGDGTPDAVVCPAIAGRTIPATIPLIVKRTANPLATNSGGVVVNGILYWHVQAVGKTYGCTADTDLLQVNLTLQYTYRSQTYSYKAMTFKANGNNT